MEIDTEHPFIQVLNLKKSYQKNEVLKQINLSLAPGKFYTILGENGSGKSTLLRLIAGMDYPSEGEVKINNLSVIGGKHIEQVTCAYISEELDLDVAMDLYEFANYFKNFYDKWDQSYFDDLIKKRKFNLSKRWSDLSRGQRMQYFLILHLATRSDVLLIDEITSVLDLYARKFFLAELRKYVKNGGTILFTTNIISEVQNYTDHLIFIHDKKIKINENIDQVATQFVKIREPEGISHEIFEDEACCWAGENSDGSISYIVPIELFNEYKIPEEFMDRREINLSDIFVYYYNFDLEEESNEKAA